MHAGPIVDVVEDESDQRDLKVSQFMEDEKRAAIERDIACMNGDALVFDSLRHTHTAKNMSFVMLSFPPF